MTTVLDLITASLQDLGAIALGEVPTAAEGQACLNALNNMVEQWNTESLIVYNIAPQLFAYVAGQASYTMGTGGDFNADRPVTIESAYNRGNAGMPNEVDYPIYVTNNYEEYSDIITKRIETTLPLIVYYNGDVPLQTLTFWPIPVDTTYAPYLWFWTKITNFALISDTITLPPGYKRALQKNLSLEVAPAYGSTVSPLLERQAVESKGQIKRINYTADLMSMPYGIPGTRPAPALAQFIAGVP